MHTDPDFDPAQCLVEHPLSGASVSKEEFSLHDQTAMLKEYSEDGGFL